MLHVSAKISSRSISSAIPRSGGRSASRANSRSVRKQKRVEGLDRHRLARQELGCSLPDRCLVEAKVLAQRGCCPLCVPVEARVAGCQLLDRDADALGHFGRGLFREGP